MVEEKTHNRYDDKPISTIDAKELISGAQSHNPEIQHEKKGKKTGKRR